MPSHTLLISSHATPLGTFLENCLPLCDATRHFPCRDLQSLFPLQRSCHPTPQFASQSLPGVLPVVHGTEVVSKKNQEPSHSGEQKRLTSGSGHMQPWNLGVGSHLSGSCKLCVNSPIRSFRLSSCHSSRSSRLLSSTFASGSQQSLAFKAFVVWASGFRAGSG